MACESCGDKPKKCNKEFTKAVIEIDNPPVITNIRRVTIPASMGDDTTVPPVVGKYHNVLLYYEANQKSYLYSSDGIPTQLVNGVTDYEAAINLPQINGNTLIGDKTGEELGLQDKLTAGDNITIENNVISATDTTYGPATDTEIGLVRPGDGLEVDANGTMSISDIEQYAHFFDTVADMKAADLADGDYARTGGFHAVNDGGGALYKITDTGTANEMDIIAVGGALYAQAVYPTVINPEMFGAYGDGTHDDSATLQYAFDLHKPIRLTKTYKTTTTINLCDWNYINVNAEGSIINYTGTGSAFFIYHIYGGDVRFGRIFSENGSCIKIASTDGVNDRVIYLNVFFTSLRCSDKCIEIINGGIGYVAEVRFYGGQIGTSQYGVHVTNDVTASNAGSNGLYFYNIGFEGSATNYYFNAPTYALNGISMFNNRYVENTSNTMFKFVGKMARIYMQSWGPMKETRIDSTDLTSITNSKITCPIMNSAGSTVFAQGIVWDKFGNKLYVHESKSQPAATLSSDVTGGTVKLELINGLAFIRLSGITSDKHSYDIVDTTNPLPDTFKPKANMVSSCVTTDGATATFWVRANGSIAFSGDAADHGKAFTGELIYYPLADNT